MDGTKHVVLVVEDEPDLAGLYAQWLRDEYEVRKALDGHEALEQLDLAVDAVLLDRRMPDVTGDEVLAHIGERGLDCRVAMVTAVDPGFDIVEMGFDDYLQKPVDREDLRATVSRLLSLSTYDREVGELYSLASKQATLLAEISRAELERSDEFAALNRQLAELSDRVDDVIDDVDATGYRALFRDLDVANPDS